ncbi:unnamed protein product [Schistosoma mattheei]|uniref:Uncharacterized protein n=1 Tax=Schistosoma mattheei TaxID=31246 RepID=A0A183NIC9_9TREM|nr:unnamed protein product [Schistosoma mattheei]
MLLELEVGVIGDGLAIKFSAAKSGTPVAKSSAIITERGNCGNILVSWSTAERRYNGNTFKSLFPLNIEL